MREQYLRNSTVGACAFAALAVGHSVRANAIDDAIQRAANALVLNQAGNGSWASEPDFAGPIVSGLLDTYNSTGTPSYNTAATNGGNFIIAHTSDFLGDETYALTRLSAFQLDPTNNTYR